MPYIDRIIGPNGQQVGSRSGCLIPGQPSAPPPSPQEIWDAVDLPTPTIGVNPHVRGLTGLETWLWYEGPTTRSVSVTLNGYTVTAQAEAVEYVWNTGDGGSYSSPVPGTEDNPAARHTYTTRGDYTITLTVRWEGTFTMSAPGFSGLSGSLGFETVVGSTPYGVIEAQAVRSR